VPRALNRQILAVLAGFVLLGSVVACGGSAGSGLVPGGSGGAASSSSSTGAPSVTTAGGGDHHDGDCDSHKGGHDDGCTPAPSPSPTSGGGTTVTTYQNIRPLALYAGSGVIDFLVTSVSVAPTFTPFNTGLLKTDQFTVPMTCAVPAATTPQPVAAGKREAAVTASATPPPTPTPTNLPVSNCVIVAYAGTSTTAMQVTGPASIDGANLIFPATSPGLSYSLGTSYTFYVAIATTTVVPGGPSPSPAPCAKDNDKHGRDGHDRDRHEDDRGNHKDCGHHYGDDDDGDGGHGH
jgi:hypothetical protein